MKEFASCKQAMESCMQTKTFAVAHLYKEEKTMDMHIHDCCEIYFSISGGKQFLIDNKFYSISPGDLFAINQYESHYLTQIDRAVHERIVISVHPDYVKFLSRGSVNLGECFEKRNGNFSHRISLSKEQKQRFLYLVNKICDVPEYGGEVLEEAAFMELMVLINSAFRGSGARKNLKKDNDSAGYNRQVDEILAYINRNIANELSIGSLASHFFMSESYICRIFKAATGTTINKYITARRISIAKALLNEGLNVQDAYEQSGFSDYSTFFKAFGKAVGLSPKRYSQCSIR
ncbi:MAG: AraC family transcriptional regulator [Lachnospiraceae bacterium]|nr:AraC family transcriptional regulator [Lachnospiraceae bacterium]